MVREVFLNIPIVDQIETAENVLYFLKQHYEKQLRVYQSTNMANLQSPSISDMPKGSIYGNSNEEKMTKFLSAKMIVDGFNHTLEVGSYELKIVCQNVLGKITANEAMERLYLERTRYYEVKRRALNEFADIFEMQTGCPDLHVYKK